MSTFGILVGGGPAPGINCVIGSAARFAMRAGHRVLGIRNGFEDLMNGDLSCVRELDSETIRDIHFKGGSILHTSRANPTRNPQHLKIVVESLAALGVEHLITIGGDDTAFSSRTVCEAAGGRLQVVHVPKTIDNDLPLPKGIPTFGYETARHHGALVLERLLEDAYTRGNWFFVVMMGRNAGHLALGTGKAAGATITLVAEEFPGEVIHLEDVARILEGAVVKRLASGRRDGVAVISEGIGSRLDRKELSILDHVPRDEHGHIRLADVPLGRVLQHMVQDSLKARGIEIRIGSKDVGYELRCAPPVAFDRDYTLDLGVGAVRLLLAGVSGVMVTRDASGEVVAVSFEEMADPETGRTATRMLELDSDAYENARALMVRVEQSDLDDREICERLAEVAKLSVDEFQKRYTPLRAR